MGRINVLPFSVANLIAAGEVVDRPASVIKELLENAIDSGADRITVEIQNGGVTFMRVSDNGCGIEADDLPVAIRRHATSKIRTADDLDGIVTLGFRGEALAAIASVSHMRILSKTEGAESGCMLEAQGGEIVGVYERACGNGTSVIVEDLFANVPARRKFLKKDVTEATAVSTVVEKIALSKPHIAFRLIVDGSVRLDTVGDGDVAHAVHAVFGRDFSARMIPVKSESEGITVEGFVGRSDNVRANRNYQNFFINGRYVKSKTAGAALEQAYTSYIAPDKFPCCVLFLTVHPSAVDVNVHPAKLEVKFSNEKTVFEAIYYAVREALSDNVSRPSLSTERREAPRTRVSDMTVPITEGKQESLARRQLGASLVTKAAEPQGKQEGGFFHMTAEQYAQEYVARKTGRMPPLPPANRQEAEAREAQARAEAQTVPQKTVTVQMPKDEPKKAASAVGIQQPPAEPVTQKPPVTNAPPPAPEQTASLAYRVVGELFHAYVVVEYGDKMLLVDKHAAHERVIFERLKAAMLAGETVSQLLLLPLELMMTTEEIAALNEYREQIEATGFAFSTGRNTVSVSAIPEGITPDAVSDVLGVMADRLCHDTGTVKLTRDLLFEKALYQGACKAAIKAGREYPPEYVRALVDELMHLPDITFCPHGRPVAMEMSKKKIDHQFERS